MVDAELQRASSISSCTALDGPEATIDAGDKRHCRFTEFADNWNWQLAKSAVLLYDEGLKMMLRGGRQIPASQPLVHHE